MPVFFIFLNDRPGTIPEFRMVQSAHKKSPSSVARKSFVFMESLSPGNTEVIDKCTGYQLLTTPADMLWRHVVYKPVPSGYP